MKSIVANNVKKIMKARCIKQGAVAERAGYDPKKFSNMMNGRKVITDVDVMNIANAMGVEPNDLYGVGKRLSAETGIVEK